LPGETEFGFYFLQLLCSAGGCRITVNTRPGKYSFPQIREEIGGWTKGGGGGVSSDTLGEPFS
jgi:hypothetical protein